MEDKMGGRVVSLPQESIIHMLKALPEDALADIFWRTFIEVDRSPMTSNESADLETAVQEFKQGETVKWQDLR
jgi:hypothetical protein